MIGPASSWPLSETGTHRDRPGPQPSLRPRGAGGDSPPGEHARSDRRRARPWRHRRGCTHRERRARTVLRRPDNDRSARFRRFVVSGVVDRLRPRRPRPMAPSPVPSSAASSSGSASISSSSGSTSSDSSSIGTGSSSFRSTYCLRTTKEAPTLVSRVIRSPSMSITWPDQAAGGEHLVADVEGLRLLPQRLGLALLRPVEEEVEGGPHHDEDEPGGRAAAGWTWLVAATSGSQAERGRHRR